MKTDIDYLKEFYDNHFGKPFDQLVPEEIDCLKDTYSFQLFMASTKLSELLKEIGSVIFKDRQN